MSFFPFKRHGRQGFSLLELLAVLGVISVLVVLSVPMLSGMGKAQGLTTATSKLKGQFALARQVAMTKNQNVELRFYLGPKNSLQATQVVALDDEGKSEGPESPVESLSQQVAALPAGTFSTLLTDTSVAKQADRNDFWQAPVEDFAYVTFTANGAPDLPSLPTGVESWTLTLVGHQEAEETSLPANFATFVLNPVTGLVKVVRPE